MFFSMGTPRMKTVVKKTSMPFKNFVDFNTHRDQIQLKHDGDDVVFTGHLIEFHNTPSVKKNVVTMVKEVIVFLK